MFTFCIFFTINLRYFILYAIFYQKYSYSIIHSLILPILLFMMLMQLENNIADFAPFAFGINLSFSLLIALYIKSIDNVGLKLLGLGSFKILTAYLYSWVCSEPTPLEEILEKNSIKSQIKTYLIELIGKNSSLSLVTPGIHPGPFSPVGSYNLPYEIINFYKLQNVNSMVFHSPSSHDVNLPSKRETENYLSSLREKLIISEGYSCSKPVKVCRNKVTLNGLKFNDVILVFVTFAPYGIEDLPSEVQEYVKKFEVNGIKKVIVVDAHNALGPIPTKEDVEDLKYCLDELIRKINQESPSYAFKYNFTQRNIPALKEVGPGGISCLLLLIEGLPFVIYSIDSNNAIPQLRPRLENELQRNGLFLLEMCTTDSHFSSGKVLSKKGYYALGELSDCNYIICELSNMAKELQNSLQEASFKVFYCESNLRILGHAQIDVYSKFISASLKLAKIGAVILLILSLLLMFIITF